MAHQLQVPGQQQRAPPPEVDTATAPVASSNAVTGYTLDSFLVNVLKAPDGVLRLSQWFCAMVSFSAIADAPERGLGDNKKFLLFVMVTHWLLCFMWPLIYMGGYRSRWTWLMATEGVMDILYCLFSFAASVAIWSKCNDEVQGVKRCRDTDLPATAGAFAFFVFVLLFGSLFFDWKRWRTRL